MPQVGVACLIPAIKLNSCLSLRSGFKSLSFRHRLIEATAQYAGFGGQVMSKREKEASNTFRPSDRPLTEYEREQIALRKNLERLRAERLARENAKSKDD